MAQLLQQCTCVQGSSAGKLELHASYAHPNTRWCVPEPKTWATSSWKIAMKSVPQNERKQMLTDEQASSWKKAMNSIQQNGRKECWKKAMNSIQQSETKEMLTDEQASNRRKQRI